MSDDIRVYWDKYLGVYSIVIGDTIIHAFDDSDQQFNSYMSGSDLTNDDELVYDSAEHEDYSLIDENLVVPDVYYDGDCDGSVGITFSKSISMCTGVFSDPGFFSCLLDSYYYHKERTA